MAAERPLGEVLAADVTEDGILDLVAAQPADTGSDAVYLAAGLGGFAFRLPQAFALPGGATSPTALATGDLDGDEVSDVAVACRDRDGKGGVAVLSGTTDSLAPGSFFRPSEAPGILGDILVGDFTDDGNLDVAAVQPNDNRVLILAGDSTGSLSFDPDLGILETGGRPQALATADLDQGWVANDLAVANQGDGTVTLLLNDRVRFSRQDDVAACDQPQDLLIADLDADSIPELAVGCLAKPGNPGLVILHDRDPYKGTGFSKTSEELPSARIGALAVADLNRDQLPDLLALNQDKDRLVILLNRGQLTFEVSELPLGFCTDPVGLAAGSFQDIRRTDLAVACQDLPGLLLFQGAESCKPSP
jgi:hypothetical protein